MNKTQIQTLLVLVLSLSLGGLVGCVNSLSFRPVSDPSIASFVANPTSILPGASSSLTGTFVNGTGVITPGNLAVTSGTAVSVTPSDTTTYTLTVTNAAGVTVTQTAVVTVSPTAPAITSFVANPTSITAGGSASLTGIFANGTGVITPGNLPATSGTPVSVTPSDTTTYTLTVTNAAGATATLTAVITVNPAAPAITSFIASPTSITAGGSASLTGIFANGTGVITPGNLAVTSGTAVSVTPSETTTYTLTVTNAAGATATLTSVVTVNPAAPAITSLNANPASITAGGTASLTGIFANGTGVITPGNLPATSGTPVSVAPSDTTTYTLTVTNAAGVTVTQTAVITVNPAAPAITSFIASPTSITAGGTASLTGIFANGTGVITPGNLLATSGTAVSVTPSDTTTYTLTVTNAAGVTVTQAAVITVNPAAPAITSFIASPTSITAGGTASLTGVFANGTGVITPGDLAETSGTPVSVTPSVTTIYTLTVTPPSGTAVTKSVTVSVSTSGAPAAPTGLQATPGNQQVSLNWTGSATATSYSVLRSTTTGGPYIPIGTTTGTVFEDDAVVNNTTYYYVVAAVNSSGQSGDSNQASATPMLSPKVPSGLTATAGDGQAVLTWTAGTGAASYQVGRSTVSGGPYTTVGTSATTSFTDKGLTDGATYYYVTASVNPVATSGDSNQAEAIPVATPTGLIAIPNSQQVGLFWNTSAGATSYSISQFTQSGCAGTASQATTSIPRLMETGLTNSSTYYFEVTALNSTGSSGPSACVSGTPSASSTSLPPPQNPNQNYVGLGTWFLSDWDGSYAFLDMFKQSRVWDTANWGTVLTGSEIDSLGWPTQDASTVIFTDTIGSGTQFNGTYDLSFTGQATVALMWCNGSVANQSYNSATNTTTAKVTFTESGSASCGLYFTNTKRTATSPVGSGFTNAHLYLSTTDPGSENPLQGTTIFSKNFLTAMGRAGTVRMMDWTNTNDNYVQYWENRVTPQGATQAGLPNTWTGPDGTVYNGVGGVALEYQIILCNTLLADCYFNIPMVAGSNPSTGTDYVTNMAMAIAYGTDGTNPYNSPQANPVYPPLNPNLRFYLEYANEVWNSGNNVFGVIADICQYLPADSPLFTPDNNPGSAGYNQWYTMWRYPAFRMYSISQTFEGVFGSEQMMTRVRPLVEEQQGNGQDTLQQAMTWLDGYAQSQGTTVAQVLYGGGGSAYYPNGGDFSNPDTYFDTTYPDAATTQNWIQDSMWTTNYGIKHVAYEGGPGLTFTNATDVTVIDNPAMETFMEAYQTDWAQVGGDVLVYYTVEGPGDWEFTPDINPNDGTFTGVNTPKFAALTAIQAAPKAAVTLGATLPGTLTASALENENIRTAYGYNTTVGSQTCVAGFGPGTFLAYPANAAAPFTGNLTLSGTASAATQVGIWVNGVQQGTVTLAANSKGALENSSALSVTIPAGLTMIRMQVESGGPIFCSLTVQ
ncbi:MAG: hypothetical protein ABSC76_02865 [Terracidiphilus sp.]